MIRNRSHRVDFLPCLAAVATTLLAGSSSALAQSALGSGNALDASLKVGDFKRNAKGKDFKSELAFRNAIVTGNAGAGLSFRGDIGYRAADDFRSTTGTDDLYNFRRDSDYSGLATLNIRGIGNVQDQFNFATGGQTRSNLAGDLIVQKGSAGFSGQTLNDGPVDKNRIDPLTRLGSGSLRSTSNGFLREASRPGVLAFQNKPGQENPEGQNLLIASPLQGVRTLPERNPAFGFTPKAITGLQSPEQVAAAEAKRLTEIEAEKPGSALPTFVSPYDTFRNQLETRVDGKVNTSPLDTSAQAFNRPVELTPEQRKEAGLPGGDPLAQANKPAGEGENSGEKVVKEDSFEGRLQRLREVLSGKDDEKTKVAAKPERPLIPGLEQPGTEKAASNAEGTAGLAGTTVGKPSDGTGDNQGAKPKAIDPQEMVAGSQAQMDARIRKAIEDAKGLLGEPQTITSLKPTASADDLFLTHMTKGQAFLEQGRWFDAEERFALALSLRAGDPMAAAGRVHAQIAAGMYLSAALNLRNTFRAYPELIAAKYVTELLPRGERLQAVRAQLRARSERDSLVARDAGLLLTYLGWQTGNGADVKDGLAVIDRVNEKMAIDPDPLDAALRAVWGK
jgi:hypothetical protein